MNNINLIFRDIQQDVVTAWEDRFRGYSNVSIQLGSIFDIDCDALVSPANSYGFMDGGLDLLISNFFGGNIQENLQKVIQSQHHGELLVGCAEVISTNHPRIPFLISAPTMRVPMAVRDTVNVYLATRAALLLVVYGRFSDGSPVADKIKTVAFPGMGTGTGRVSAEACARQMAAAVDDVLLEASSFPSSLWAASDTHERLVRRH